MPCSSRSPPRRASRSIVARDSANHWIPGREPHCAAPPLPVDGRRRSFYGAGCAVAWAELPEARSAGRVGAGFGRFRWNIAAASARMYLRSSRGAVSRSTRGPARGRDSSPELTSIRIVDSARDANSTGPCVGPILLYMCWSASIPDSRATGRANLGAMPDSRPHCGSPELVYDIRRLA